MAPRASEALEAMLPSRRRWSPETLWIFSLIRTVDSQKSGTVTSDSSASCQFSQNSTATMPTRTNRLPSRGSTAVTTTSLSSPMSPITRTVRSPLRALLW